ncbi:lysostaphin resistance A-like protein [Flavobacterium sp. WC2430]|jgi:uncharacterized protein|uniref:Lysostaphin resistance A-like protein n=2 Tax=unclassified Flavobacterium TaxID=196869 RepID=A0AB39WH58_9FLAO
MSDSTKTAQKSTVIGGIAFLLFILFTTTFFLPSIRQLGIDYKTAFFISRLIIWICLLLTFLYAMYIEKQPFLLWKEKEYSFPYYLASIAVTMIVLVFVVFVVSMVLKTLDSNLESKKMNEIIQFFKNNTPLIWFTSITAGITEELLFRGYLIPRLEIIVKNTFLSVLISSILFGLLHYSYGTLIQVIGPFSIGLVLALHYQKYRNIKIVIICHSLWDLASLLVNTSH